MASRTRRYATVGAVVGLMAFIGTAAGKDAALSMEHFRDTATVADTPQDATATISTEPGYAEKRGPLRTVWNDEFLVATIDKKTARKTFQVIVWMTYAGSERAYQQVSFVSSQGPKSLAATRLNSRKEYCSTGECTYTERLAFPIEEETLRQLAARDGTSPWSFKLTGKSGSPYTGVLTGAEAAGLLAKVDSYHSTLPVVAAGAARAALKASLGIEGLPVSADAEHPNRGGVLITAVERDGVAHRSSLIVGDIIYELNGHALKSLADLEKAVAGCAPDSSVPIKLYRGLADTQLSARF